MDCFRILYNILNKFLLFSQLKSNSKLWDHKVKQLLKREDEENEDDDNQGHDNHNDDDDNRT